MASPPVPLFDHSRGFSIPPSPHIHPTLSQPIRYDLGRLLTSFVPYKTQPNTIHNSMKNPNATNRNQNFTSSLHGDLLVGHVSCRFSHSSPRCQTTRLRFLHSPLRQYSKHNPLQFPQTRPYSLKRKVNRRANILQPILSKPFARRKQLASRENANARLALFLAHFMLAGGEFRFGLASKTGPRDSF